VKKDAAYFAVSITVFVLAYALTAATAGRFNIAILGLWVFAAALLGVPIAHLNTRKTKARLKRLGLPPADTPVEVEIQFFVEAGIAEFEESISSGLRQLPGIRETSIKKTSEAYQARTRPTSQSIYGERIVVRLTPREQGTDASIRSVPGFWGATFDSQKNFQNVALLLKYLHTRHTVRIQKANFDWRGVLTAR
jgi:hypothetical protein